jgi:uncharacterized protein
MQFMRDQFPGANVITHVGSAGIRIGELQVTSSVILSASEVVPDWPVHTIETLDMEALAPALALSPEILILGTGEKIRFPHAALYAGLANHDVGLEVMDTAAACRTYNVLVADHRAVVAALILP